MGTIAFSRVLGLTLLVSAASLGAQTGTLTVYKTFEPASLAATMAAPASFPVQITCTSGVTTTVGLNSGNQFQAQTSPMPSGTVCTIIELTPQNVALRPGCRWALVAYPKEQSVTIPSGTASLVVQNGINCEDKPPVPNVSLRKTGGGAMTVGATATFYLTPANPGPGSVGVNGATVVDTLPAMFGSVTATGAPDWGCSVSGLVVTCVYTGSVGPNQSMAQIIVTARAEREGNRANCATITPTPGPDAQPGDNRSCVAVTVTDAVVPVPVQSLTVRKILVPAADPGKFVLRIDNINRAFGVGHNGSTGAISLTAGSHTVTEGGYPGTNLADYTATFGGDCNASGTVSLTPGSNKTCTITNTRRAQLRVVKKLIPATDSGRFNLFIDGVLPGGVFGDAAEVGNNGTTGFVMVSAGPHLASESGVMVTESEYAVSFSANCPGGNITLQPGAIETCTITNVRKHGSWTMGPGNAVVTVCAAPATCTITGVAGQVILVTFEAWGAGGGGASGGRSVYQQSGGQGGGGGGGGGYGKTTATLTIPSSGSLAYYVNVGAGGAPGVGGFPVPAQAHGKAGGLSEVRLSTANGALVLKATGGGGGVFNNIHGNQLLGNGIGGAGGTATLNSWPGLVGSATATSLSTCTGGAGGPGGVGGGPGAINNGGGGGHGGYLRSIAAPTCMAQSSNQQLTDGAAGANGRVTLTW